MKPGRNQRPSPLLPFLALGVSAAAIAAVVGLQTGTIRSPFAEEEGPKVVARPEAKPGGQAKGGGRSSKGKPRAKSAGANEGEPSPVFHDEVPGQPLEKPEPTKSPTRLAYEKKADAAEDTPEAQMALALWCEQNQMPEEARGHWDAVIRLDPDHRAARAKLGFNKYGRRWLTDAMVADEDEQEKADKRWKERLGVIHRRMHNRGVDAEAVARKAIEELTEISDTRAAPALWHVFAGHPAHHLMVAQQLGTLKSPKSSLMLAAVAAYSVDAKARRASVDELKTRDPVDFAEPLIALLGPELKYRKSNLPSEPGGPILQALEVEDERFTRQFIYFAPSQPGDLSASAFGDCSAMTRWANFGWTADGKAMARELNKAEAKFAKEIADRQIESDIEAVQALNRKIQDRNDRVGAILIETTGRDYGLDRDAWNGWLASKMDKKYVPPRQVAKVQFQDFVQPIYQPSFIAIPPTPS